MALYIWLQVGIFFNIAGAQILIGLKVLNFFCNNGAVFIFHLITTPNEVTFLHQHRYG